MRPKRAVNTNNTATNGGGLIVLKKAGRPMHWDKTSQVQRPFLVGALVVGLFLVSVLDAVMWAHV
jgi:hypothetical protein